VITDRKRTPYIPPDLYAMTLDEIAAETGMTKKNVAMTIQRGLRKLAQRPALFSLLLELSALRQQLAAERQRDPKEAA
jgi:DNA-binding transcriptional regulator GbsR (MarR family)